MGCSQATAGVTPVQTPFLTTRTCALRFRWCGVSILRCPAFSVVVRPEVDQSPEIDGGDAQGEAGVRHRACSGITTTKSLFHAARPYRSANGEGPKDRLSPVPSDAATVRSILSRSALSAYGRRIPKRQSLVLRRAASGEQATRGVRRRS